MGLFQIGLWPLWVACVVVLVSAVINVMPPAPMIPNALSLGAMGAGLAAAAAVTLGLIPPTAGGGLPSSLVAALAVFVLLAILWIQGYVPAGTVKLQVAFAVWVGCALDPGRALSVVGLATAFSAAILCAMFFTFFKTRRALATQPWVVLGTAIALVIVGATGLV